MMDYGFSTDEVQYDKLGLPIGVHKVLVTKEEIKANEDKPNNPNVLIATLEIVEGQYKGKSDRKYFNINHVNPVARNIARQELKRIGDATGQAVAPSTPLLNRVFVVEVRPQKNDDTRTEIFKYHPESYKAENFDVPA